MGCVLSPENDGILFLEILHFGAFISMRSNRYLWPLAHWGYVPLSPAPLNTPLGGNNFTEYAESMCRSSVSQCHHMFITIFIKYSGHLTVTGCIFMVLNR